MASIEWGLGKGEEIEWSCGFYLCYFVFSLTMKSKTEIYLK